MVSDVYFPRVNGVSTSIRTMAKALVALPKPDQPKPEQSKK